MWHADLLARRAYVVWKLPKNAWETYPPYRDTYHVAMANKTTTSCATRYLLRISVAIVYLLLASVLRVQRTQHFDDRNVPHQASRSDCPPIELICAQFGVNCAIFWRTDPNVNINFILNCVRRSSLVSSSNWWCKLIITLCVRITKCGYTWIMQIGWICSQPARNASSRTRVVWVAVPSVTYFAYDHKTHKGHATRLKTRFSLGEVLIQRE